MQGSRTTSARVSSSASDDLRAARSREQAHRALAIAVLSAAGLAASACSSKDLAITRVDVVDRTQSLGKGAPKMDRARLEAEASKIAERLPGFALRPAKKGEASWQLTVEVELMIERPALPPGAELSASAETSSSAPEQVERAAAVSMRLACFDRGTQPIALPLRFESEGAAHQPSAASSTFDELLIEAMKKAGESVAGAIALVGAKEDKILEALKSADRGVRARAVVMAGERKMRAAVPVLIELVGNELEEQDIVLKGIGALVAIGDERAVGALIDAGRRQSSAYLTQIFFAVAELGGKEAEAYLFTVSNGHADPDVRKNAREALDELHRRRRSKDPKSPGGRQAEPARSSEEP